MTESKLKSFWWGAIASIALAAPPAWSATAAAPERPIDLAKRLNEAFVAVADQVSPAVVVVRTTQKVESSEAFLEGHPFLDRLPEEWRRQFQEELEKYRENQRDRERAPRRPLPPREFQAQGSGIVIRADGFILTNGHVIENAEKIEVRFRDGRSYPATVQGTDRQSDLAVLKIETKGLTPAILGDSAQTRVGEFAIAIGAPFELEYSVTVGHISAKGRSSIIPDPEMDQDFLQTDANINPGNSGGPLINLQGEVIGINTMIRGLSTGIGFAVPSNLARQVSDELIAHGKFTRAWLGVRMSSLADFPDPEVVKGVSEGVVIQQIGPQTPAAKGGLKPLDIITAVDGRAIASTAQLKSEIRAKKVGADVVLEVVREGKPIKITVQPEAWPEEPMMVVNRMRGGPDAPNAVLGMTVKTVTADLAREQGIDAPNDLAGVIVTQVNRGSAAETIGIKKGDIITEVNQKSVTNARQFRDAVRAADPKKGVVLSLINKEGTRFEILKESR